MGFPVWGDTTTIYGNRLSGTELTTLGTSSSPYGFVFESTSTLWVLDDSNRNAWNLLKYTAASPLPPWQNVWTPVASVSIDNMRRFETMASRTEGAEFVLYTVSPIGLYRVSGASNTAALVSRPASGDYWHGVALAPYSAALAAAPAPAATPDSTPSPAATPPPPSAVDAFQPGNLLVLRMGAEGVTTPASAAAPLSVLEFDPVLGAIVQEIAIPSVASGANNPCVLYNESDRSGGYPLLSGDGKLVTFMCYHAPSGGVGTVPVTWGARVVAIVRQDGSVDTSQRFNDAYYFGATSTSPAHGRSVWTVDGQEFWLAGRGNSQPAYYYWSDSGVRHFRYGDAHTTQVSFPFGISEPRVCTGSLAPGGGAASPYGTTLLCTFKDASLQAASWFNYAGNMGLGSVVGTSADGLPRTTTGTVSTLLANITGTPSLWAFVFESDLRMWAANSGTAGTVISLERASTAPTDAWAIGAVLPMDVGSLNTIYSLVGRMEGPAFVLYASSAFRIVSYNTLSFRARTLFQSTGSLFRGLTWVPTGGAPASSSVSRTPTQSATGTPSPSQTGSQTGTPSSSATPEPSLGSDPSQSRTETASATLPPSATASPRFNSFQPGNVLILRGGEPDQNVASGVLSALYLDEIMPFTGTPDQGYVVQSIPLPSLPGLVSPIDGVSYQARCCMPLTTGMDAFIQLTADGRAATFVCYDVAPGGVLDFTSTPRTIAVVWANGTVDTRTVLSAANLAPGGQNHRSAVSADVTSGFFITSNNGANIGVRYVPFLGTNSSLISGLTCRNLRVASLSDFSSTIATVSTVGPGPYLTCASTVAGLYGQSYAPLSQALTGTATTFTVFPGFQTFQIVTRFP